jgi:antitoxin HicB
LSTQTANWRPADADLRVLVEVLLALEFFLPLARDDNETILVSFPDFPEAHSYGDDAADALAHAQDALATVIDAYIKDKREVPRPSTRAAHHHVTVPALIEAKLALCEATA